MLIRDRRGVHWLADRHVDSNLVRYAVGKASSSLVRIKMRPRNIMSTRHLTGRLQRPALSVVACRPSTLRVGVKGNVRLRARLRLVSDRIIENPRTNGTRACLDTRAGACAGAARPLKRTLECNTCGREVVRREPGRKICPSCESYWIIVELVTMGRVNRQMALPFSASQILFGPRRRARAVSLR